MIVLAVSGWKGSGKDTMADYLIDDYGYTRVAFADVLKEMVAEQYNLSLDCLYDQNAKEQPLIQFPLETKDGFSEKIHEMMLLEFRTRDGEIPQGLVFTDSGTCGLIPDNKGASAVKQLFWTPRALCILEGSVKRSVDSSYWVQRVVDKIEKTAEKDPKAKFVITDLRYRSEISQLVDAWPYNLVTCRIARFSDSPSQDPSERDLDKHDFDYIIDNTSTIEDFFSNIDDAVCVAEGSIL